MVEVELRCECREAVSGSGGASLPLSFLCRENKDLPPLDCREDLSLENMLSPPAGAGAQGASAAARGQSPPRSFSSLVLGMIVLLQYSRIPLVVVFTRAGRRANCSGSPVVSGPRRRIG